MKLEKVFQLYRRMLVWSPDFCDEVTIIKLYPGDNFEHPTDVISVFKSLDRKELTQKERLKYDQYCEYNTLQYLIDDEGNMVWQ